MMQIVYVVGETTQYMHFDNDAIMYPNQPNGFMRIMSKGQNYYFNMEFVIWVGPSQAEPQS